MLITRDQSRAYALVHRGDKDFYLIYYQMPSLEQKDEYKLEGSYQNILKASLDEKFLMVVALEPRKRIVILNLEEGLVKDVAYSYSFEYNIYNLFLISRLELIIQWELETIVMMNLSWELNQGTKSSDYEQYRG